MCMEILLCIALRQDLRYVRLASNSLYNLERAYILDSSASISPVLWLVIGGLCAWFAIIRPTEIITKNGIGQVMPSSSSLQGICARCVLTSKAEALVQPLTDSLSSACKVSGSWVPPSLLLPTPLGLTGAVFYRACQPSLNHKAPLFSQQPISWSAPLLLAKSPLTHQGKIMPSNHFGFSRLNVLSLSLSAQVLPAPLKSVRLLF